MTEMTPTPKGPKGTGVPEKGSTSVPEKAKGPTGSTSTSKKSDFSIDRNSTANGVKNVGAGAGAVAGGAGTSQLMFLLSLIEYLKSLAMTMIAGAMNLFGAALAFVGAVVGSVGSAVGGFFAGAGSFVSGLLGVGQAAGTVIAASTTAVATTAVAVGAVSATMSADPSKVDELIGQNQCVSRVDAAMMAADTSVAGNVDAITLENAKHIYAILAGAGMPDENIAGILGNWNQESWIDPTGVETIYTEPFTMGPRKKAAEAKGFLVDEVAPAYGAKYPAITQLGIGLGQWTNDRHLMLLEYAKQHGKHWSDIQLQLEFMVSADDPVRVKMIKDMIAQSKGSPDAATEYFMHKWEGLKDGTLNKRKAAANSFYAQMSSWQKDEAAGQSLLDMSSTAVESANIAAVSNASSECLSGMNGSYDNSSIANAMLSYAWPTIEQSRGNDGTELYQELHRKIFPGDPWFKSCDRSVAVAVRWSGSDDSFPAGPVSTQVPHMETSDKWEEIDWGGDFSKLQPGDIVTHPGHIWMWIGEEGIQQKFGKDAVAGSNIVHGSLNTRSPGAGKWYSDLNDGRVFRNVKKEPMSKYANLLPQSMSNVLQGGAKPGDVVASGNYIQPVNARITSPFGYRTHPTLGTRKLHEGVDYGAACGTPIKAVADGVVMENSFKSASGNRVAIDHGNGIKTFYFHMVSPSPLPVGTKVKQGDIVGRVGTTGRSTGCHLHFGVKDTSDEYVNPMILFKQ